MQTTTETTEATTTEMLKAAREWIAECVWADMDPEDIALLTDAQVLRGIARHFEGGLEAFRATM